MDVLPLHERNRQIVAHYFEEFWTKGNTRVVNEVCSDDFTVFYPMNGRTVGKTAAQQSLAKIKLAFPDISFKLLTPFPLIAEKDYVVARWVGGGRHTGQAFFGLPIGSLPVANSGKEMRFSGTTIFRLKDGKIEEEIGEESGLLAMQQLGLMKKSQDFSS